MANTISNGDHVQVTYYTTDGLQYAANVLNYLAGSSLGTGATDAEMAAFLNTTVPALYAAYLPTTCQFYGLKVQIIGPPRRPAIVNSDGQIAGTVIASVLPTQVCGLASVRTNLTGKSYRGRVYFPFASQDGLAADGNPTGALVALWTSLAFDILTPYTVPGAAGSVIMTPCVWSRLLDTLTVVAETEVESEWATERRRATRSRSDTAPF